MPIFTKEPLTFETWKKRANEYATRVGCAEGDLFDEDDPYGVKCLAPRAFAHKISPRKFVRDTFGDGWDGSWILQAHPKEGLYRCSSLTSTSASSSG